MPAEIDFQSLPDLLQDPLVRKIVGAAAAIMAIAIVFRIIGGWRRTVADARRRAELRRFTDDLRLRKEEVHRLAERVLATSSTGQIAGFELVRQVEMVFADNQTSSAAAVELVKALAVRKGANALINLQTRQLPAGKWIASGDAVIVRSVGLPTDEDQAGRTGQQETGNRERETGQ